MSPPGLLLDTHVFLWAGDEPARIRAEVRDQLLDPALPVYLSAVVVAELAVKLSIGKLRLSMPLAELVVDHDFEPLELTAAHAERLADLPLLHRDPFDRLLIAQAIAEGLTLVTADHRVLAYPGVTLLDARH